MAVDAKLTQIALTHATEGILVTDTACRILYVNPAFSLITGYSAQEVLGESPKILSSGRHGEHFFSEMWQAITEEGRWEGEIWNKRKDGDLFPALLTITAVRDQNGEVTHYSGSMVDIKERKIQEIALKKRTTEDPVTGLLNRKAFRDRMSLALRRTERAGNILVILFIRFPHLLEIRNSLGQERLEQILFSIGDRLHACLRAGEDVSRHGELHFAICLGDLKSLEHAARVAQRIILSFEHPVILGERPYYLPAKVGVSLFPSDGKDPDELLTKAETAARLAQEEMGESFRFFIPDMHDRALARFRMEGDLRQALDRGEFTLHYQPKVNLKTGRISAVEALLRWVHPQMELVSPATFIPLAEETDIIVPLGEWVMRTACAQGRQWRDQGVEVEVSVNLSAVQFRDSIDLPGLVGRILQETGLPAQGLKLELTESRKMDYDQVGRVLKRLAEMGVTLSMDDFGTGYSNFSYLSVFPLSELKLDRSYIQRIGHPREFKMVSSILSMAKGFKLKVVGEGVEDRREVSCLAAFGCDEVQGYCLSRPMPAEEVAPFIASHQPAHWQYL